MPEQLLRLDDVVARVGLKRSAVYERGRRGVFPRPIKIDGVVAAWLASEVEDWIQRQILASRSGESASASASTPPRVPDVPGSVEQP